MEEYKTSRVALPSVCITSSSRYPFLHSSVFLLLSSIVIKMKGASLISSALALCYGAQFAAAAPSSGDPGFPKGQPYDGKGKGSIIVGMLCPPILSSLLTQS